MSSVRQQQTEGQKHITLTGAAQSLKSMARSSQLTVIVLMLMPEELLNSTVTVSRVLATFSVCACVANVPKCYHFAIILLNFTN